MKLKLKIVLTTFCAMAMIACGKEATASSNEVVRPKIETVVKFTEQGENKTTTEYIYDKPSDRFWIKAIVKDGNGKAVKSINRELDPETRMPVKEYTIDEMGEIDEIIVLEYDVKTALPLKKLIYKEEVKPENLLEEVSNTYINGVLDRQTYVAHELDGYKNVDGSNITYDITIRFMPSAETRGRGEIEPFYKIESRKVYLTDKLIKRMEMENAKAGDIYFTEKTTFDELGYPKEYTSTDPNAGTEHRYSKEYYVVKTDKSKRLLELTPYANPERDSIAKDALMWKFEYDKTGKNSVVTEIMLNEANGKFDLIHGRYRYKWLNPIPGQLELYDAEIKNEGFCQHRKVYSMQVNEIEKFDTKEKITVSRTAEMQGGFPKEELPGKVTKRTTLKFETIKLK